MELDEAVRTFLSTKPDSGDPRAPLTVRRAAIQAGVDSLFAMFGLPVAPAHREQDVEIAVPGGPIRLRIYRPSDASGRPVHVFLHGGGFWLGSIDEAVNDATCRTRCTEAGCVVVAVDYRLSPEHPFPTPLEDCYAGLLWAVEHAAEIGGDPANVSIGGVSAGSTLAAAVALLCRDRPGPALRLQLLEVPPLDLTLDGMRASGVGDDFGITIDEMALCRDLYLPSPEDARRPLASPLHAATVAGLPPAQIMTAQFDPLRHDGERYADRLRAAGVPVSYHCYPGAVHGAPLLTGTWPTARTWQDDLLQGLREAHFPSHR
ncbi:alpha/beta hydrolase [Paractinoplanes toevensis]|uniref:Lipase LipH n=1 Tax=Paractinoplanes toevensis TaxID=571911 RepID=A0A920BQN7_9ACTN|nr:alpha/beta hydrolase [Actinoplanes toevensis]GIM97393.1 putative lipase LipH [Actinoplanes toevensis]